MLRDSPPGASEPVIGLSDVGMDTTVDLGDGAGKSQTDTLTEVVTDPREQLRSLAGPKPTTEQPPMYAIRLPPSGELYLYTGGSPISSSTRLATSPAVLL